MPEPTILSVAPRFTRAVHIQRDFRDLRHRLDGYQLTPLVRQATGRILAGLEPGSTERAFSIVGPFGAGKSAFALFLGHYVERSPESRQQLLSSLKPAEGIEPLPLDPPSLLAVPVAGNNSALRAALLLALSTALKRQRTRLRGPAVEALLKELQRSATSPDLDPQRVADLVATAAELVRESGAFAGLLLIIDELGQFLDYAARHDEERDLFVLQSLAELAARSGETPCLLVTILHQAFERYTLNAGSARRLEWAKVQGRFADLPFQEPAAQMVRMVARALRPTGKDPWYEARHAWSARLAPASAALGLRPAEISDAEWAQLLADCYPLHPTVLVALPQIFRQLAQNERSLFAFLHSDEPWSLRDIVGSSSEPPIYRLTHLYAYVEQILGPGLFTRARGQRWAELAEARALLADDDPLSFQVLTVVGTIGALERSAGLRADRDQVALALCDATEGPEATAVVTTLAQLEARRMITYRRHRTSYILWEGSDLDLEALALAQRRELAARVALPELLQRHTELVPRIARRHSYRSGATRAFAVRFVAVAQLDAATEPPAGFDGELLHVVATDEDELAQAIRWATEPERATEPQRLVVLPRKLDQLRTTLLEVASLRGLLERQPELEHDRVARREVAGRLMEAEQILAHLVAETYGGSHGSWFHLCRARSVNGARELDELLSLACDATYPATPRVWNELIVRRQISAAAARARRNLVEARVERADQPQLGIIGYPPERAIYESLLRQGGLHHPDEHGVWRITPPPPNDPLGLQPAWRAMEQRLELAGEEPLALNELLGMLERAPYGVKAGLAPLLVVALYLVRAGELSFYERGSYLATPDIATFERILARPEPFALRLSRTEGVRLPLYRRLAQALAPRALEQPQQPALLAVVLPLLRLLKSLPEYSRQTRRVSVEAQAIRRALRETRSPDALLFTELPQACGEAPFDTHEALESGLARVETFATALRKALQELQEAYPRLIQELTECIRISFGLRSSDIRAELHARCSAVLAISSDTRLRTLHVRLETADLQGSAWVESVAALVTRRPPEFWSDEELPIATTALGELASRLRAAEELALATRTTTTGVPLIRIGLASGRGEVSRVVNRGDDDPAVGALHAELSAILERHPSLSAEQRAAALVGLLEQLME